VSNQPTIKQLNYLRALAQQTGTSFTPPTTRREAIHTIRAMKKRKRSSRSEMVRERREVSRDMATRRGDAAQVKGHEIHGYGSSASWQKPLKDPTPHSGPRVVNCKDEPCEVLVDRSTKWGNPFRVGVHGTREECIAKHAAWLPTQPHLVGALHELRGKTLGCHCAPRACHADTLLELANAPEQPRPNPPRKDVPHAFAGYKAGEERRLIVLQRFGGRLHVGDVPAKGKGKRYLIARDVRLCGELQALIESYTQQAAQLGGVPDLDQLLTRIHR